MVDLKKITTEGIYKHFKKGAQTLYVEETHCKLLIDVMLDPNKGCVTAFCVDALIHDATFFNWVNKHELFRNIYYFSRLVARQVWEDEGRKIRDTEYQMGTLNYNFEHWRLMGWTRFGVSRNSRLKLNIDPTDNPAKHYEAILRQAAEGDFTASEFKQLMEAVNVGLNVHQVFELQKQIDELKSDLSIMATNKDVQNPFTDQRPTEKN